MNTSDSESYSDYIFIIYSCKKNLSYANNIYNYIKNKLEKCKIFIIYGDTKLETEYKIIGNYIILKVLDDYHSLYLKTIQLFKTINILYPNTKGVFKCDDDIIPNLKHLNSFILSDTINTIDFCGRIIDNVKIQECRNIMYNKITMIPIVKYCGGPLYYVSNKSIDYINNNTIIHDSEDVMIGLTLNSKSIYPYNYNLYTDTLSDISTISYHNSTRDATVFNNINNNYVSVEIKGGLCNQLFQIGCAMGYCEKYNKNLQLSRNNIKQNTHQSYDKTIKVINTLFPNITIYDNISTDNYYTFNEVVSDSFNYNPINTSTINNLNNIMLKGYFINPKYLPDTFICSLSPTNSMLKYTDKLDNFKNTYFIHIRLGDYLDNELYKISLETYYNYCITQIKTENANANFIVCTNEYSPNLDKYVNNFPKDTTYIIQDRSDDELDTLYIMSLCKGGICSNSTMSWMGIYFQKTKDKNFIYMPYPWVKFINGFNHNNTIDIYPNYTQIYDTINENMMIL